MSANGYEKSACFYDLFDEKQTTGFFGRYAARAGRILDVGAGTGRIAIPLVQHGIHVVCVEPSPARRRQLLEKLKTRPHVGDRIELLPDEAASFHIDRTFPVACLSGTVDRLLDREERLASFRNVVHHLVPSASLVFDVSVGLMTSSPSAEVGCRVSYECSDYDFTPYQEGNDLLIVEAFCPP